MYWCLIESSYIDYLKKYESRIPNINYGDEHIKPFFAPLFQMDNLVYVTQVTSPKPRHYKMKNQIDFIKYYSNDGKLIGAINLNYMFPVPKTCIIPITSANIAVYKKFKSEEDKSKYISFLKKQMKIIEGLNIDKSAMTLYKYYQDNPDNIVSKRCFNFTYLENKAADFKIG